MFAQKAVPYFMLVFTPFDLVSRFARLCCTTELYANSKGSGETAHMHCLARALAVGLCDKLLYYIQFNLIKENMVEVTCIFQKMIFSLMKNIKSVISLVKNINF